MRCETLHALRQFRMTTQGYYMSAIAILFSIPIFGTGVVLSSGAASIDEDAKVNLAGPLSNLLLGLILSFVFLGIEISGVPVINLILFILRYAVILNGMLGLFNMIPFAIFDGATIYRWNKGIWGVVTLGLLALLIMGFFVFPIL